MASKWIETTLGEVLTLQRGFDLPETDRNPGPYVVIASTGPVGTHPIAMVKGPGVVIGRSGSLGGGQFIKSDFWPLNTTLWVKDFKGNDPRYCYYLLKSLDLAHFNAGSGVPTLNRNHIHPLPVRVPADPREQCSIANVLGTLDDKIELNQQMSQTLEGIARAIFKSWFVDFDPVRTKYEGRDPGLPKHLADLFPDSFEESEMGEIPSGWRVATIDDVAETNGWTLSRTDTLEVIDYIEISEVMKGEVANIVRYDKGTEPSRARRRLKHGDTVLSTVRPDREAHFLCLNPPATLVASTGFAVFSPRDGNWAFLYSALTRRDIGEELGRLADGGAYPAVLPEVIAGLNLILPSDPAIVSAFHNLTKELFERPAENRIESRSLAAVRDTIMPKLISGELRVGDAKHAAEETHS